MFFGQILVPLYEDLPGDPVIPASIRNAKIWKFWKLQKKFSNYEKKTFKIAFFENNRIFQKPKMHWCFLVKSSYPCTRICQEIRWFQQAFEMPKFENFENFKRSFQIMKKNFQNRVFLEKSHFSEAQNALPSKTYRAYIFFGQVWPFYENLRIRWNFSKETLIKSL